MIELKNVIKIAYADSPPLFVCLECPRVKLSRSCGLRAYRIWGLGIYGLGVKGFWIIGFKGIRVKGPGIWGSGVR